MLTYRLQVLLFHRKHFVLWYSVKRKMKILMNVFQHKEFLKSIKILNISTAKSYTSKTVLY